MKKSDVVILSEGHHCEVLDEECSSCLKVKATFSSLTVYFCVYVSGAGQFASKFF